MPNRPRRVALFGSLVVMAAFSLADAATPGTAFSASHLTFAAVSTIDLAAPPTDSVRTFESNCALCHQKGAVGVRGEFPRLAGRIAPIASTDAGRRYLQQVVLFGMAGSIEVDGQTILGVMPAFATLSNNELAAALNYLVQLGPLSLKSRPVTPFTAATLQALREGPSLSPTQVHEVRPRALSRP